MAYPFQLVDVFGAHSSTGKRIFLALLALLLCGAAHAAPAYTPQGDLKPLPDYREFVFLSSSIDMSYTAKPAMAGESMFNNVFVDPVSWLAFKKTGQWPDGTLLVLENRGGTGHGSITKLGKFQTTELMGLEVHVRDDARFKGGWGFFAFDGDKPAKLIPMTATCYSCHLAHGAVQTTFTQFYPTAKPIAQHAHNYRED